MRVYTYARYSTDRQTEASIVDQHRRCHQYADSRGWLMTTDFKDEGISGAALGNRPGFQRAMSAGPGRRCSISCGPHSPVSQPRAYATA